MSFLSWVVLKFSTYPKSKCIFQNNLNDWPKALKGKQQVIEEITSNGLY